MPEAHERNRETGIIHPVMTLGQVQLLAVWMLPVLLAITVHEVAHGWMALRLGDRTAMMLGRLTLNPLKHIDPIGTVLVPMTLFLLGGVMFGWARPVPVTRENLRRPERDMALVAVAGPGANLVMALLWLGLLMIGIALQDVHLAAARLLVYLGTAGIVINAVLMVLNLLPVPPLDGSRVVASLLPGPLAYRYGRIEPYGLLVLLLLLVTGYLGRILSPVIDGFFGVLFYFDANAEAYFRAAMGAIMSG